MNRGRAGKRVNKAQTRAAVRVAASDVKGAFGRGKPPDSPRPVSNGLNWLIALSAGAAVAWKSWKTATQSAPDGKDNVTANQFQARQEQDARNKAALAEAAATSHPGESTLPAVDRKTTLAKMSNDKMPAGKQHTDVKTACEAENETTNQQQPAPDNAAGQDTGNSGDKLPGGAVALAKEFYRRVSEDELTTRAAALAFVGVLSLVPILLFAIIALGFVFRDPVEASHHVQQFLERMLPGESASSAAEDVLAQTHIIETAQNMTRHAGWPLVIGIGSLVWAGISLFVTASTPMDTAWDVTETRGFIQLRLTALGLLLGAGLVLLLSLTASALPDLVVSLDWPLFGANGVVPVVWHLLFALLAVVFDVLMFVLIYKYLPNAPVTWKAALFSGTATGLLWEFFKQAFALYLAHFGNSSNKMYGALGGVVLLITWIYYSCIVLLIGAILGKMYNEHKEEGGVKQRPSTVLPTSTPNK